MLADQFLDLSQPHPTQPFIQTLPVRHKLPQFLVKVLGMVFVLDVAEFMENKI